ncbi:sulfatase-like hydrolase/transferase [Nocardioides sp. zg-1228]|uniref:sulfatase-like hydrolase/transferase n=1 Tax=Nocardioides sp. zg-1228 TaxID=2763008 RepID=UPI0016425167|nr:sulfatase-like hydrolase/transferase [Nocardioides sp. zg-1228]MBC2934685.1 sulfatase-like hydrolase/transferase [Nocardioides sp. zg-1228]QSF56003.1 sulfatase-like hydrolase/transferase [Nocardioides sp. zg-1228]
MRAWAQSVSAALLVVLIATLATVSATGDPGDASGPDAARMVQGTQAADAGPARPNLVFVLTDDMRDDDLDHMPITRRLLADQGMEFTDAISPHPLCCPARAQLATGQYAQNNGVQHNRGVHGGFQALDPTREASAWFRDEGYRTAFVGKFLNGYGPRDVRPAGWSRWDALTRGTYDYVDFTMTNDGEPRHHTDAYVTSVIEDHANEAVRDFARSGDPFVVYAWHIAPHYRITPEGGRSLPLAEPRDEQLFLDERPASFDDPAFDEDDVTDQPRYLRNRARVSRPDVAAENTARLQALQSVDRAVGSLVETLATEGVLDETYLVFASDNGYSLGEHRYLGKDVLTDEALQVPLLVRGPGIVPGSTSALPVTLVDLPATFAALAGVTPQWQVDGTSLAPTLRGEDQAFRDTTLIQTGRTLGDGWSHRGVRTERYLYGTDGTDGFLYDRLLDPDELVNLVDDPAYAGVRAVLEQRRRELTECAGWTCNQQFGPVTEPVTDPVTDPTQGPS